MKPTDKTSAFLMGLTVGLFAIAGVVYHYHNYEPRTPAPPANSQIIGGGLFTPVFDNTNHVVCYVFRSDMNNGAAISCVKMNDTVTVKAQGKPAA